VIARSRPSFEPSGEPSGPAGCCGIERETVIAVDSIERFCNAIRQRSTIGDLSPAEFELNSQVTKPAAAQTSGGRTAMNIDAPAERIALPPRRANSAKDGKRELALSSTRS
jgi:hypothetical protein